MPALVSAAYVAHTPTETSASDTATSAAIGSGERNSNYVQPTDGPFATPIIPVNPDGDVMLAASSGESDDNLEYAKSPKNLPLDAVLEFCHNDQSQGQVFRRLGIF